jgi:hypothetical protein
MKSHTGPPAAALGQESDDKLQSCHQWLPFTSSLAVDSRPDSGPAPVDPVKPIFKWYQLNAITGLVVNLAGLVVEGSKGQMLNVGFPALVGRGCRA